MQLIRGPLTYEQLPSLVKEKASDKRIRWEHVTRTVHCRQKVNTRRSGRTNGAHLQLTASSWGQMFCCGVSSAAVSRDNQKWKQVTEVIYWMCFQRCSQAQIGLIVAQKKCTNELHVNPDWRFVSPQKLRTAKFRSKFVSIFWHFFGDFLRTFRRSNFAGLSPEWGKKKNMSTQTWPKDSRSDAEIFGICPRYPTKSERSSRRTSADSSSLKT